MKLKTKLVALTMIALTAGCYGHRPPRTLGEYYAQERAREYRSAVLLDYGARMLDYGAPRAIYSAPIYQRQQPIYQPGFTPPTVQDRSLSRFRINR